MFLHLAYSIKIDKLQGLCKLLHFFFTQLKQYFNTKILCSLNLVGNIFFLIILFFNHQQLHLNQESTSFNCLICFQVRMCGTMQTNYAFRLLSHGGILYVVEPLFCKQCSHGLPQKCQWYVCLLQVSKQKRLKVLAGSLTKILDRLLPSCCTV